MAHTRRAQILMEPEEYERLERIARARHSSVGELIRAAIRAQYLQAPPDRTAIVERIASMNLPSGDWADLKHEIEAGYDAGLP